MKADFPVTYLCQKFQVSTSAFYEWSISKTTATTKRRDDLTVLVIEKFGESHSSDGYRKVTAQIHRDGVAVNRKTVASIMSELGLMSPLAVRSFKRAKARKARVKDPADLLDRDFESLVPGSILVGDITYVPTKQGWLYVATVIDLASRSVLGHATGARQTTSLIVKAMNVARKSGLIRPGTVFHTDHGSQYRSKRFQNYCRRAGIRRSMGGRMECWDNACAETFFSKLKGERLDWLTFTTRDTAATEVESYIDHFNNHRLHQTLDYLTPTEKLHALNLAA